MAELFPLSDLRDPVAFLMGARVPINGVRDGRIEWVKDILWFMGHGLVWGASDLKQANWNGMSIDLADPDVARWCDRKIAEALIRTAHDGRVAWLAVTHSGAHGGKVWRVYFRDLDDVTDHAGTFGRDGGGCDPWTRNLTIPMLANVWRDEAHLPTARAALIRALYGKEAT